MPSICKKHGKPRDVVIESFHDSKKGKRVPISWVGCTDCATEAKQKYPELNKRPIVSEKSDPPKPEPQREKTLAERFGFRF